MALGSNAEFDASSLGTNVGGGADPHSAKNSVQVTITDAILPLVSLTSGTSPVMEGADATFNLSMSPAPSANTTITLNVTQNGSFAASGQAGSRTVVVGASGTGTLTVRTSDDSDDEAGGSITAKVQRGVGYAPIPVSSSAGSPSATVNVADNDGINVTVTRSSSAGTTVGENAVTTIDVVIRRSLGAGQIVTVPLTFSGAATRNVDYTLHCHNRGTGVSCDNLNSGATTVTFTGGATPSATSATITFSMVQDNIYEAGGETVDVGVGTVTATGIEDGASTPTDNVPTFRIIDHGSPSLSLSLPGGETSVTEGGAVTVRVTSDWTVASGGTLPFTLTASATGGYTATLNNVNSIAANGTSADVTLSIAQNNADNPRGAATVALTDTAAYNLGSVNSRTLTVIDNDPTGITLAGATTALNEGGMRSFMLDIGRGLRVGETLVAPLTFAGSAAKGTDYTLSCASATGVTCNFSSGNERVTFTGSPGGSARIATITLTAVSDGATESGGETVNVGIGTVTATSLDGGAATPVDNFGQFTINDPPPVPTVSFTSATYSAPAGSSVSVTVNITPTRGSPTALSVASATGTAGSGDFTAGPYNITIPANSGSTTFTIATASDDTVGSNKTFTITIGAPPTGVNLGSPSSATVNILRGPALGIAFISATPDPVPEGSDVTVTLGLFHSDGAPSTHASDLTIQLLASAQSPDERAPTPSDILAPKSVTIPAGESSQTFIVRTLHDDDDSDETVTVEFDGGVWLPSGITQVHDAKSWINFNIKDSGKPSPYKPTVSTTAVYDVTPEGGNAVFYITADKAPRLRPVKVHYRFLVDGDFGLSMLNDQGIRRGYVTFHPGDPSPKEMVYTGTRSDDVVERHGEIIFVLVGGGGYHVTDVPGASRATVMVRDTDSPPAPTPSVSVELGASRGQLLSLSENREGPGNNFTINGFTVRSAAAVDAPVKVNYTLGGTATLGVDYRIFMVSSSYNKMSDLPDTLTLRNNRARPQYATTSIFIEIINDDIEDSGETITLTLASGDGYTLDADTAKRAATWIIENDDLFPPSQSYQPPTNLVSQIRGYAAEINSGPDHVRRWKQVLIGLGVETYPGLTAMTSTEAQTYADRGWSRWVPVVAELQKVEAAENGPETTSASDATPTPTPTPAPDATPTPTPIPGSYAPNPVVEANVRSYIAETNAGSDHLNRWKQALIGMKVETYPGLTAMTAAEAQTYADRGWSRWVPVAAELRRAETAPTAQVSVNSGREVTEGEDVLFRLTASPPPSFPLKVNVNVAQTGDFGVTTGSRTVSIGTSGTAFLIVSTEGDSVDEDDGSVTATLTSDNLYTVSSDKGSAAVAVADDDVSVISISSGSGVTEGSNAIFTLTASPASTASRTVNVNVAQSGDFGVTTGSRTVTIGPDGTATLSVSTKDDSVDEANGSVTATLAWGSGYTVSPTLKEATVAVADDDNPPPVGDLNFSIHDASGPEGQEVVFKVTLSKAAKRKVQVSWESDFHSTADNYALPSGEFWYMSGDLVFQPGETVKSARVFVDQDTRKEGPEVFVVKLSNPQGADIKRGLGVMTIVDDD